MTTAFIGLVIMTLARDVGNRILSGTTAAREPSHKGRVFDREA